FAGMMVGLYRHTQNPNWIWIGTAALVGIVLSFWITVYQRTQITAKERPEEFASRMHGLLESRRENWLVLFGRHMYFMVRRAFLPYAVLFFAIIGRISILVKSVAIGANVFWVMCIYCMIAVMQRRSMADLRTANGLAPAK